MIDHAEKYDFLQLLQACQKLVIPKIQRDYAQGRVDVQGAGFYREIRDNFLASLYDALVGNSERVLDYIYGSNDETSYFYPIDGQQRLTTLFLLYWYIGMKEHRLDDAVKAELKKFSYEIRDTTAEFCSAIFELDLDIVNTDKLSDAIRQSNRYHSAFERDPSAASMLYMLDELHKKFRSEPPLWDRLKNITFWALRLENFGLTDDLFVKMNARGERLSKFDTFKSDLESALDKRLKAEPDNSALAEAVESWKINIDNDYLDNFWRNFPMELSERNLFRLIMFFVKCHNAAQKDVLYYEYWETHDDDMNCGAETQFIADDEEILSAICQVLKRFPLWKGLDACISALLIKDKTEARTITFYDKVRLFGLIYWWAKIDDTRVSRDFTEFFRVLSNHINNIREYDVKTRQFRSQIDQRSFGRQIAFVKKLIDDFAVGQLDFVSFVRQTGSDELKYEREKYLSPSLDKIKELEEVPALYRLTQNFFFDGQLYVDADELNTILKNDKLRNQYLRIVLSYAPAAYGRFINLVFDGTTVQTGYRIMFYDSPDDQGAGRCHRLFLRGSSSFGEKFLTAPQSGNSNIMHDLSVAIRAFAKAFYAKRQASKQSVEKVLDKLVAERLTFADFSDRSSILWYIIKYNDSFFYEPSSTTLMVLRRKNYFTGYDDDNVYHIRCTSESYELWNMRHYNPFYVALSRYLKKRSSSVIIDKNSLYIKDNRIEYAHPCMLSNGWRVQILQDGNWKVSFNGHPPINPQGALEISEDAYILENSGTDCIELLGNFILNYGALEN